jgi:hypothetical protein
MVFSTNKTDHHDITEILLKVALHAINQPTNKTFQKGTFFSLSDPHRYFNCDNISTGTLANEIKVVFLSL